jgi:hypothetical protein
MKCTKTVADAVIAEPVSTAQFPANREINRDYFDSGADSVSGVYISPMILRAYGQIPYSSDQGVSGREQGISGNHQGKFVSVHVS